MSDSMIKEWLKADEIILLGTSVHDRFNVDSFVVRFDTNYVSYKLTDHPSEYAGPLEIEKQDFSSSFIESALEDNAPRIAVKKPSHIRITRTFEMIYGIPASILDTVLITSRDKSKVLLQRQGAAYPTSLFLVPSVE